MKKYKLLVRGLNFHGQCGLGKKINYTGDKYILNENIPDTIYKVEANQGHTFLLDKNNKTIYFFGFNWDLRSFLRVTHIYQRFPKFLQALKYFYPPLSGFPCKPCIIGEFVNQIIQFDVGGAFALVLDGNYFKFYILI